MTREHGHHLTIDELDGFLSGQSASDTLSHVATCMACADLVAQDAALVAALEMLPRFDPAPGFADRVLRAALAAPQVRAATPRQIAARRRGVYGIAASIALLAVAFGWAATHAEAAWRMLGPITSPVARDLWATGQSIAASVHGGAWFGSMRATMQTPMHAVVVIATVVLGYLLALAGFKRLMSEPVAHASW